MSDKNDKIIAVASGKGGVGKTWLSITLAHAFVKAGERVLLFDGDLGLANVDIQLGLMADKDLGQAVAGNLALNQVVFQCADGGFDVIVGRSGSGLLRALPLSRLQLLLDDLKALAGSYDRVIVDVAAGVDDQVITLVGAADRGLVVTNDEPTSLTDAYALIKVARMRKLQTRLEIVVNSAAGAKEGGRTYDTLNKACKHFLDLNVPLAGIVRRDSKVRETIRGQSPLLTRYPFTEAAEDVVGIATGILKE